MGRVLKRSAQIFGASALLGLGYIGTTWIRYGKVAVNTRPNPLLDRFMPESEVREVHETRVDAPATLTLAVAQELDIQRSRVIKAIFAGREVLMGAKAAGRPAPRSFLSEVVALGWRELEQEPGRHLVMGAVTQPWQANVQFRGLGPEEFVAFNEPGYAKILWTMEVEPRAAATSLFRTETRVLTTDAEARRRFRRYWSFVSPGVRLIRREMLRMIRREAELRAGAAHSS